MSFGLKFIDGNIIFDDQGQIDPAYATIKHTETDFGLKMLSFYIPEPSPKVATVNIPFSSGSVDLTEATGTTPYSDRSGLSFEFKVYDGSYIQWEAKKQQIAKFLHGKKLKMIPDSDQGYYYNVRLAVDSKKSNKVNSTITLTGSADPFKYELVPSSEPWLWDPFNFQTGVIQDTSDIKVNGTKEVTLLDAGTIPTCPEFFVSEINTTLKVTAEGKTFTFTKAGANYRFPQIRLEGQNAKLTFTGKGKVSVAYRGRAL